jgi:arylformamidase
LRGKARLVRLSRFAFFSRKSDFLETDNGRQQTAVQVFSRGLEIANPNSYRISQKETSTMSSWEDVHMVRIYDVSVLISADMATWPGDSFLLRRVEQIGKGDVCNKSLMEIGSHIGTHIDAPYHFEREGMTIEQIPLDTFVGPARVASFPDVDRIDLAQIRSVDLSGLERILFKTRNSQLWQESTFREDYVYLTYEASRLLAESGVKLVGVDYLSIEKYGGESFESHHVLLSKGIALLEGLDLTEVAAGDYELMALPLKIAGGDGSPVRAVLKEMAP